MTGRNCASYWSSAALCGAQKERCALQYDQQARLLTTGSGRYVPGSLHLLVPGGVEARILASRDPPAFELYQDFRFGEGVRCSIDQIPMDHTGLLGPYHYNSLYDYLVATSFLPPRCVCTYPACSGIGTARGLCELYGITGEKTGAQAYGRMLAELTWYVKKHSTTWGWSDHMVTVGGALCWLHRMDTSSSSSEHATRLEETSRAHRHREQQLAAHGFVDRKLRTGLLTGI